VGGAPTSAIPAVRRSLALAAGAGVGPLVLAKDRLIEVPAPLAGMLPEGGLRRGSTLTVATGDGTGCTSLALALAAPVTRSQGWVAAVGLPSLGLVAAAQLGVALDHLALVPAAGGQWPVVAAAILDSFDVLLLAPESQVRPAEARRLTAKARERGVVLMVLGPPPRAGRVSSGVWPERADVDIAVSRARWDGLQQGAGYLQARVVDVVVSGRRAAARPRRWRVWLPGADGRVAADDLQPARPTDLRPTGPGMGLVSA
jgi:hypothetical protein